MAAAMTTTTTHHQHNLDSLQDRLEGALWGFFAGDALSAPTHWYYGGSRQIQQDYGTIKGYVKPHHHLAGSILNKSDPNGGGRAKQSWFSSSKKKESIVGDAINHGKLEYWDPTKSIHYHATLQQGENTLEVSIGRVLMKSIVQCQGRFDANHFRQAYATFMMTPGSHNDTYASTCHRMFFANHVHHQLPLEECPDNDQHNVNTIDALILPTIVALSQGVSIEEDDDTAVAVANCVGVTRNSPIAQTIAQQWAKVIRAALFLGEDIKDGRNAADAALDVFAQETIRRLPNPRLASDDSTLSACYLSQSLPGMIDLLAKYGTTGNNVWKALLSNANVGGENVHRGSIMGALLGARAGKRQLSPLLLDGLYHKDELAIEIDDFVQAVLLRRRQQEEQEASSDTRTKGVQAQEL